MKSIRARIILLMSMLLIVVCGGFGIAAYITSSSALITNVEKTMPRFAMEASKTIEFGIQNQLNSLEATASNDVFISYLEDQQQDGTDLFSLMNREVSRMDHLSMAVIDIQGRALYNDGSIADFGNAEFFTESLNGARVLTDPFMGSADNSIEMIYSVPISFKQEVIGVLIVHRDGYELSDLADEISYGASGKAFIINQQGRTIAHADKGVLVEIIKSHSKNGTDGSSSASPQVDDISSASIDGDVRSESGFQNYAHTQDRMTHGETGFSEYTYDGIEKYIGFAPIKGHSWSIGVEVNRGEMLESLSNLGVTFMILSAVFLLIGLAAAYAISSSFVRPIEYLTRECGQMASGDFSSNIKGEYIKRRDEIGGLAKGFSLINKNVGSLIGEAADVSDRVNSSSQELNAAIQQSTAAASEVSQAVAEMAQGVTAQAEDVESGATKVDHMGRLIDKIQEYIEELSLSADQVDETKEEGLKIVEDLVHRTQITGEATEKIYNVIINTNESADKIGKASFMIEDIAKQTNLLALNAAIEAARAGESGRGFAVVAEKIRVLAEESNKLTKEIGSIIMELIDKTQGAVSTMKSVSDSVDSQTESVKRTNKRFKDIADAVEDTRRIIKILDQSSTNMRIEKDDVIGIIQNLSAVSQQNAAGTEEVSASVEEQAGYMEQISGASDTLARLAEEVNTSIGRFRV